MKLPKGKACAQAAHASVSALDKADPIKLAEWKMQGQKKVVLKVIDKKEIFKYKQLAEDVGLTTSVITDAGRTVVEPGTTTCMAIGPDDEEKIDKITGNLKMM